MSVWLLLHGHCSHSLGLTPGSSPGLTQCINHPFLLNSEAPSPKTLGFDDWGFPPSPAVIYLPASFCSCLILLLLIPSSFVVVGDVFHGQRVPRLLFFFVPPMPMATPHADPQGSVQAPGALAPPPGGTLCPLWLCLPPSAPPPPLPLSSPLFAPQLTQLSHHVTMALATGGPVSPTCPLFLWVKDKPPHPPLLEQKVNLEAVRRGP